MAALVVIVAALDSTGGRLTLIESHSGLTGGCTNNASLVETKAEQWKKWGRSLKTRGVGGVGAYAPAISVHHLHSPPEPQQWGSCSLGAEELHQGVQVSPPGRSTLGSVHFSCKYVYKSRVQSSCPIVSLSPTATVGIQT